MKIKSDKYKKARGGQTKMLKLYCAQCGEFLFEYQKDGPGSLKRTYLDRISNSPQFQNLQHMSLKEIPQLICPKCFERLGVPMIYKKENRLAFRLLEGKLKKK